MTINGDNGAGSIFEFGNVNYNGSFGRGLSFGNQQDVVLNSTLNLQLSGFLADSIQVAAAIASPPAQRIVPVGRSNPGSPKARKSQDVMAGFGQVAELPAR